MYIALALGGCRSAPASVSEAPVAPASVSSESDESSSAARILGEITTVAGVPTSDVSLEMPARGKTGDCELEMTLKHAPDPRLPFRVLDWAHRKGPGAVMISIKLHWPDAAQQPPKRLDAEYSWRVETSTPRPSSRIAPPRLYRLQRVASVDGGGSQWVSGTSRMDIGSTFSDSGRLWVTPASGRGALLVGVSAAWVGSVAAGRSDPLVDAR
jgi:hypothetical protein